MYKDLESLSDFALRELIFFAKGILNKRKIMERWNELTPEERSVVLRAIALIVLNERAKEQFSEREDEEQEKVRRD